MTADLNTYNSPQREINAAIDNTRLKIFEHESCTPRLAALAPVNKGRITRLLSTACIKKDDWSTSKKMAQAADKTYLFEKMPIRRAILKQIIPSIAGQMIILIYNLTDTYFVGLLNDPRQTAAVTVVASSFVLLTAVSSLFAVGGATLMARSLGQKDEEKAKQISAVSFWGGLFISVVLSLIFLIFSSPILHLCGATEETYKLAFGYAKWVIIIGSAGSILNILLANLIRAEGNSLIAALGVSLGGLCNIILDPFFVLPQFLGQGAVGAGAATAISNMIATLFLIAYIISKRKSTVVSLSLKRLRYALRHIKGIIAIGIPSVVQHALTVVSVSATLKFVSGYETEAVAGLGIVRKLDLLPLYFAIGVANGMLPLLAYNFASGNSKRRHEAFLFGCAISLGFAIFCLVCYEAFAPFLTGLFIDDALTISYSSAFLRIMVVAMPMMSICYPMIVQFQAMGRVREALVCSILRKGVIDIPLLFVLNRIIPLYGCMMVQPIVDTVSLIVAICFYRKILLEDKKKIIG